MNANARTRSAGSARLPAQLLLLLASCAFVYFFRLGEGGFFGTEAHRAVPAYEMLDHARTLDAWLVPEMFGQPYLRKPPGMPWAIAGLTALLGETVFAARAVSALSCTATAFIAFFAAKRWFGARAALPAGLAQALMPVLWETGRAAEIEPLNNLGTQIASLALVHLLVVQPGIARGAGSPGLRPRRGSRGGIVCTMLLAALGIVWFSIAKGPASAPVVVAVVAAACVVRRSISPLLPAVGSLALAAVPLALLGWLIVRALERAPVDAVTQSPSAFMFEPGMVLGILTLPLVAFAQTLPASFALLFPWGPDARREAAPASGPSNGPGGGPGEVPFSIARTLAVAWLIAVGVFMLFGVRNPRYTLPAACLLPPLAGCYLMGLGSWLAPQRDRIARVLTLGGPRVMLVALLVGAGVYMFTVEARRRATTGEEAGHEIAARLADWHAHNPGPAVVIADDVVEARPEVIHTARRDLEAQGLPIRFRWTPGLAGLDHLQNPSEGSETPRLIALIRTDPESAEADHSHIENHPIRALFASDRDDVVRFHKYSTALYLIEP